MQQQYPFQPRGANTVNLAVGTSAANLVLPQLPAEGASVDLCNVGTQTVFLNFFGTATAANGIPLLANTRKTFSVSAGMGTISAIAAATGSTLYATVGDGT